MFTEPVHKDVEDPLFPVNLNMQINLIPHSTDHPI